MPQRARDGLAPVVASLSPTGQAVTRAAQATLTWPFAVAHVVEASIVTTRGDKSLTPCTGTSSTKLCDEGPVKGRPWAGRSPEGVAARTTPTAVTSEAHGLLFVGTAPLA